MTDIKAADLPEGSVVDYDGERWIATGATGIHRWRNRGGWFTTDDEEIDEMMAIDGAVVLRKGPS